MIAQTFFCFGGEKKQKITGKLFLCVWAATNGTNGHIKERANDTKKSCQHIYGSWWLGSPIIAFILFAYNRLVNSL